MGSLNRRIGSLFNTAVLSGILFLASSAASAQTGPDTSDTRPPDLDTWEVVSDTTQVPQQNTPSESPAMATPSIMGNNSSANGNGTGLTTAPVFEIIQDGFQLGKQVLDEQQQTKAGAQEVEIKSHQQGVQLGMKILGTILGRKR